MSKISKTFQFDSRIPASDYKKYISPADLINPQDQQLIEEFTNYRNISRKEILNEQKGREVPPPQKLKIQNKNKEIALQVKLDTLRRKRKQQLLQESQYNQKIFAQKTQSSGNLLQNSQTKFSKTSVNFSNKYQIKNSFGNLEQQNSNNSNNKFNSTFQINDENLNQNINSTTTNQNQVQFSLGNTPKKRPQSILSNNNNINVKQIINTPNQSLYKEKNNYSCLNSEMISTAYQSPKKDLQQQLQSYQATPSQNQYQIKNNSIYEQAMQKLRNDQNSQINTIQNKQQETNKAQQFKKQSINNFMDNKSQQQQKQQQMQQQQLQQQKNQQRLQQNKSLKNYKKLQQIQQQKLEQMLIDEENKLKMQKKKHNLQIEDFKIYSDDTSYVMIQKGEQQINYIKSELSKFKKQVHNPDYGILSQKNSKKDKQQIKATPLLQPQIFNLEDYQRMLNNQEEQEAYNSNQKNKKIEQEQDDQAQVFQNRNEAITTEQLKHQKKAFSLIEGDQLSYANPRKPKFPFKRNLYQNGSRPQTTQEQIRQEAHNSHVQKMELIRSGTKSQHNMSKSLLFQDKARSAQTTPKKIRLTKKQLDIDIDQEADKVLQECQQIQQNITKNCYKWNNIGVFDPIVNKIRQESLIYARNNKAINKFQDKNYQKEEINRNKLQEGETLEQLMSKVIKNPNANDKEFKIFQEVQVHQNRIKQMQKKAVIPYSHYKKHNKEIQQEL